MIPDIFSMSDSGKDGNKSIKQKTIPDIFSTISKNP